jgi:phenylacetate-CoA ligase
LTVAELPASTGSIRDAVESIGPDELHALQLTRLREAVGRVLAGQPLGAGRLRSAGIERPDDLRDLEDLARVPFSTKTDLREGYPFELFAVGREALVRIHASSGTGGKPTLVGYTRADLENWTELMARCMHMAGVRPHMTVHNANGYGLFTGGFGFHQGGERLGACVVPVSGGRTARQAMLLSDLASEVLVATPSYALILAQGLRDAGVDPMTLPLELGLFGGEPWGEGLRAEIERALPLKAVSTYGLSEMCGPGVAAECMPRRQGLHVQEDHFLVEVIDPGSGERVADGEEGELTFTTLTKEALPLLRYRTGDLGRLQRAPCPCGRTFARLTGLRGRRDDMLIVRGVNLHPSEVERVLLGVPGASGHYRLLVDRHELQEALTLECEPAPGADGEALRAGAEAELQEATGLRIAVRVLDPGTLPRTDGKAVRVLDRRPVAVSPAPSPGAPPAG